MSAFKVESGVPAPELGRGKRKYPFREMAVGDSFFVPGIASNALSTASRNYRPCVFSVRAVTESGVKGVRCWRVA